MGRRQRCGAEEGARVEVNPGHGCRAAGGVSAGRPRGERALTRLGHDAARRGQYQRLRHAETQQLGRRRWPGGVTSYLAAAVLSPERKETAALGSYLDDDGCKRTQAKQGG